MRHYATLFDLAYAGKALVLWRSLVIHQPGSWTLWMLPMDDATHSVLLRLQPALVNVRIIPPSAVLQGPLAETRDQRSVAEFCWTTTSFLVGHVFQAEPGADYVTYLDADLCFFADLDQAWREIDRHDIAVVPHRFLNEDYSRLRPAGIFNVSWVSFRNSVPAFYILRRWQAQCLVRCAAETNGDQRYLDEWPSALKGIGSLCIFESHGVGVAPWNVRRYRVTSGPRIDGTPIVFYHFHELVRLGPARYFYTNHRIRPEDVEHIYAPYVAVLERMHDVLEGRESLTAE